MGMLPPVDILRDFIYDNGLPYHPANILRVMVEMLPNVGPMHQFPDHPDHLDQLYQQDHPQEPPRVELEPDESTEEETEEEPDDITEDEATETETETEEPSDGYFSDIEIIQID